MTINQTTDEIDMLDILRGRFEAGQGVVTLSQDMTNAQVGTVIRAALKMAGGKAVTVIPPQEPQWDEFHDFLKKNGDAD